MGRHPDEHLRRFVAARQAGDGDAMRRWWEELVIDFRDRMDGLVAVNHRGRLNDFEHEDAVQRAMTRFSVKLIDSFEGSSMGELVNATKTLCGYACLDALGEAKVYRERHTSLEQGWDGGDGDERSSSPWEAGAAWEAYEREAREMDADAFLDWALPQLRDSYRGVLERTVEGVPLEEVCAEFGLSRDNAYQRRSRGLKDLAKLYQQYGS